MKNIAAVLMSLGFCFLATRTYHTEPARSYVIRAGAETCRFVLRSSTEEKYFTSTIGTIHRFAAEGQSLKDSVEARQKLMLALKSTYMNRLARIEVGKVVKLKKRGFCVPSLLTTTGEEGPAFAIDFLIEKGLLKGFVVGSSLNCSIVSAF